MSVDFKIPDYRERAERLLKNTTSDVFSSPERDIVTNRHAIRDNNYDDPILRNARNEHLQKQIDNRQARVSASIDFSKKFGKENVATRLKRNINSKSVNYDFDSDEEFENPKKPSKKIKSRKLEVEELKEPKRSSRNKLMKNITRLCSNQSSAKLREAPESTNRSPHKEAPSCGKIKLESRKLKQEVKSLSKALETKENKLEKMVDRIKQNKVELKKARKALVNGDKRYGQEIDLLREHMVEMRQNENILINDLVEQQRIAKQSLKTIETLSEKYEKEKEEMKTYFEKQQVQAIQAEQDKFELRLKAYRDNVESLTTKLRSLEEKEEELKTKAKAKKSNDRIVEEQRNEITKLRSVIMDLNEKNTRLAAEKAELLTSNKDQGITYEQKLAQLRQQMHVIEDGYRERNSKDVSTLQLEVYMKNEEIRSLKEDIVAIEEGYNNKLSVASEREKFLNEQVVQLLDEIKEAKSQNKKTFAIDSENAKLREEINEINKELELLRDEYEDKLRKKEKQKQEQKNEWNTIYKDMSEEIYQLKEKLENIEFERLKPREKDLGKHKVFEQTFEQLPSESNFPESRRSAYSKEDLKEKDEEIKILWKVLKELNKNKGDKISLESLKSMMTSDTKDSKAHSHNYL